MSIYTVHARMLEIQMMSPRTAPAAEHDADFASMLSSARKQDGRKTAQGATAATVAETDELPEGMAAVVSAWSRSAAAVSGMGLEIRSTWGGPSGYWTGSVDTSDGMIEKAAPYMDIIRSASAIYNVPVNVIMGVIKAESDYDPFCISSSGAMGLMQIMPVNAEYYGVTDPYDARQNIMCGTEEISRHLSSYNGDLKLALAAYNTGAGNVARRGVTSSSAAEYSRIPESVRAYADRVLRYAGLAS